MRLDELYFQMVLIRRFEETLLDLASRGEVPGVVHPYTGHEAIAVGALAHRDPAEWVVGYYRCHGHAIASGSIVEPLMREVLGREGGICVGRSGSMQFCDREHRFLLSSSIVGSQLSIAAGVAFRENAEQSGRAVVAFCGDGALGAGVAYEALTISRQKQLPLLLVVEDNGWQDRTPSSSVMTMEPANLVSGLGIPVVKVDGNNVEDVAVAAQDALTRCRSGGGPAAVVARTYLRDFHSQLRDFVPAQYRPTYEMQEWRDRDPLDIGARLLADTSIDHVEVADRAFEVIEKATNEALAAPFAQSRGASGVTIVDWDTAYPGVNA